MNDEDRYSGKSRYGLVASKQTVGIFLTVWIKSDLKEAVQNLKVSCVGRGLMGYLGNKGSISISMSLHQTSFCFVCSHLTSGEKDGYEQCRNSDDNTPQTILDHDRIIWLGDLNYRIALSYPCAKALVEMRNWRALLENGQHQIEQRQDVFFWDERKVEYISLQHTSIQIIQTDTPGKTDTKERNGGHLHGVMVYCGVVMVSNSYHSCSRGVYVFRS